MKTFITKLFTISLVLFAFASCDDDAELTTLEFVSFPAAIEATPNTIVLSTENNSESVMTVSWPEVQFPIEAPVTYTLAMDVAADTFGENGWANAIRIPVGEDVLSTSILGNDLNDYVATLGLMPDVEGEVMLRVEAYMDRYVYSEPITVEVTPYVEEIASGELYIPGAYNAWDASTAAKLSAIATGVYQGYLTVNAPQNLAFKVTPEQDWDEFYGLDVNGNFALGADGDLLLPDVGSYQITVNLNTLTYTILPYSWGIIGPSTANGWDADTDMSYNYTSQEWEYTGLLAAGSLKFRLNNEWAVNYGTENGNSGEIENGEVYLDNPGAHAIVEGGFYKVSFSVNPNDPEIAIYSVSSISYSWGIIGDATPSGWDADTDMTYDFEISKWTFTGNLVPGALKFRLNDEWTTNYGTEDGNSGNIVDGIMYLDNPGAHSITEAGNYEITFSTDPDSPATAIYSVTQL
ncbi:SusF/SusE family outer membrane protein [Sediminibacter sp. Hel_I_10]|uniref:SusF/SusE family outer membrane protein n=1 Tax=Sediminibacter sp. Hel_I_10 TaxID=1392490 RepID=UPI00068C9CF9|nr:SusF/SusE family outer membrane protein [Sediminibacter sp. Hel_I_10]